MTPSFLQQRHNSLKSISYHQDN
uniref:Uncharacterized protein n=1 Tax=Arundo donax TaxID=35708 RepID=A0A0A8Z4C6_ARUDO